MASQGHIIVKGVVCRRVCRVTAVITPEMNANHFFKTNKNTTQHTLCYCALHHAVKFIKKKKKT